MKRLTTLAALALAATGTATPAFAQEDAGDKVNMVIVYGDDACPPPAPGEIIVCARQEENERYRIPENLRFSDSMQNTAWAKKVESLEMIGDFGTLSCDAAGAGGFLGCTQQMIDAYYKDKGEGSDVRFSQLIAAARAERLSEIDADARETQERVEQLEKEYMERLERERAGTLPGEAAEGGPPPLIEKNEETETAQPEG